MTIAPMESNDHVNWLPGLGNQAHSVYSPVYSPVTIPESPTASPASPHTQAKASPDISIPNQEDSEDSGIGEYPICFDRGRFFYNSEAANDPAKIEYMQDTELLPSSGPGGSPSSATVNAAVTPTSPASNSSMLPSSPYWNTTPGYISLTANGATTPTSPWSTTEQTTNRAVLDTTSVHRDVSPSSTHRLTNSTSDHAMDPYTKEVFLPTVPNVSQ